MLEASFYPYKGKRALILGGSHAIGQELRKKLVMNNLLVDSTFSSHNLPKIDNCYFLDLLQLEDNLGPLLNKWPFYDYIIDLIHTDLETLTLSVQEDELEHYFQINVINKIKILKDLARKMILKKFGRFIHCSSASINSPAKGQGFYTSSKMALEMFYRQMGLEFVSKGITTLSLRYSYIQSGRGEKFLRRHPNLPSLHPKIVANQIAFFLSDDATSINATTITIDQGFSIDKHLF